MASSVTFPVSESPQKQSKAPPLSRLPHLPFRRISLPTAPSTAHRESVLSIVSVDSFPEDDEPVPPPRATPVTIGGGKAIGEGSNTRQISIESPRKRKRTRDSTSKPPDDKLLMKRKRIVAEFYETEAAYVDGLDLIYNHFLTPIISSLETSEPLLNRSALTSIFSNFIDIWNFHNSFLSALTGLLNPSSANPPNISSLLLAHFPYLSLYTPFITSFSATVTTLTGLVTIPTAIRPNPHYNPRFAVFLTTQEADARCGKLKLRDWLLTIVQRCPRYLLLLKDLINNTEREDPEHAQLTAVHTLVAKITSSLNNSLHTHAQTLSLLALQKATPNLPFQLISPGRNLIKRGTLVQIDRNHGPVDREFLLFSDCLIWLASDTSTSSWSWSGSGSGVSQSSQNGPPVRPEAMTRTRSKSDADLSTMRTVDDDQDGDESVGPSPSTPTSPSKVVQRRSLYHVEPPPPPPPSMGKRNSSIDEKWVYKGRVDLVDIEVVVGSALEDNRRFEVLSPGGSFAVYGPDETERDEWTSEIRAAKQQLFISLNTMNPNSTLTSSSSTNHVRRVLQALPYHPSDERVTTLKTSSSIDILHHSPNPLSSRLGKFGGKKDKAKERSTDKDKKHDVSIERRRKVEHWVPPVWIPDSKTSSCMRCGRMFGWRRRRHHCRLCGRCVCAGCSGRTFFITEGISKDEHCSKAARACEACYETVFPLIDGSEGKFDDHRAVGTNEHQRHNSDTITSMSHLPSWLSMPTLPVQRQPQSLMAINLNSSHDLFSIAGGNRATGVEEKERMPRMRLKSHHRLRSSQQILVDFQEQARQERSQEGWIGDETAVEDHDDGDPIEDDVFSSPLRPFPPPMRREDTARRSKRFSLPAVALHATSVTARMTEGVWNAPPLSVTDDHAGREYMTGDISSPSRHRRFSLVLAGRNSHYADDGGVRIDTEDLGKGVAAVKLADLLKNSKVVT